VFGDESSLNADFHPELKGIPSPPHLHTTLCGRRANAPAIFSTKSLGRTRIPMPKETTTTPASAPSTQRRRPCGQDTRSRLEVLSEKGPSHCCLCQQQDVYGEDGAKSTWSTKLRGFDAATHSKTAVISAPSQAGIARAPAGLGSLQQGARSLRFAALPPALEPTQLLFGKEALETQGPQRSCQSREGNRGEKRKAVLHRILARSLAVGWYDSRNTTQAEWGTPPRWRLPDAEGSCGWQKVFPSCQETSAHPGVFCPPSMATCRRQV